MNHQRPEGADLPEVVPGAGPEVVVHDGLYPVTLQQNGPGAGEHLMKGYGPPAEEPKKTTLFGWSKRKLWIVIGIAVLVVVAVVVGATVGTLVGKKDSPDNAESDNNSTPTDGSPPEASSTGPTGSSTVGSFGAPTSFPENPTASDSACHDTVCPSVISTIQDKQESGSSYVFALGKDDTYLYRTFKDGKWDSDWESLGGSFVGSPTVVNMIPGRLDVFGLWKEDRSLQTKSFRSGSWDVDWRNMTGPCYSVPAACSISEGTAHVFTTNSGQRIVWKSYESGIWSSWSKNNTGFLASAPITACDDNRIDVLAYGEGASPYQLMVKRGNSTAMGPWETIEGDFKGDPVALRGPSATAFFGIGSAGAMFYTVWSDDVETVSNDTTGGVQSLGGDFQSVPSPLVISEDRIDVVAIGTDGKLKHIAFLNGDWTEKWEDLGGFFSSAPSLVSLGDKRVAVFGISTGGDMIHGVWEIGDKHDWGKGEWFTDGGNFTSSWFRVGPA